MIRNTRRYFSSFMSKLLPNVWTRWRQTVYLTRQVKAFRAELTALGDLEAMVDKVLGTKQFRASQSKKEIVELLRLLQTARPKYLCEIGAWHGGTLALFCQIAAPDAQLLSIDLAYTPKQIHAFRHFARPQQRVTCLQADSHDPETVRKVRQWLNGQPLDFILIDGDHTLAGVTSDFEMYAPCVRAGGIIAFHDIVPDSETRRGIRTQRYTGQVPEFWVGLKRRFPDTVELIEDPEQDGLGIGVLKWPGG